MTVLIETVTDPAPGFGWIDPTSGFEIADICEQDHGTVLGGNGVTHVVSLEFSNAVNDCIATRASVPAPPRDRESRSTARTPGGEAGPGSPESIASIEKSAREALREPPYPCRRPTRKGP